MIPYEELCAALERYRASNMGDEPQVEITTGPVDPPTNEHAMPAVVGHHDDERTNAGVQPIYDDRSNELDIGDVLSDEEAPKN
jgi:hypothetical protein